VGTNDCKALLFQKTDSALPFVVMCCCKKEEKKKYGKKNDFAQKYFFNEFRTD